MKIIDPILSGSVHASGSLVIPKGTSDQKPSDPKTGSLFVEISDSGSNLVVYNGSGSTGWQTVGDQATPITPPSTVDIEYLVVAGGGGAGWDLTAGGGAGGLLSSSLSSISSGSSITVTVGAGGAGYTSGGVTSAADGTASSIASATGTSFTTVSTVGGGGGSRVSTTDGRDGGSGGGCGRGNQGATNPGSGTTGQGNDGGADSDSPAGTGGGGAGAAGSSSSGAGNPATGGAGGAGKASKITGASVSYAGGGGGGGYYGSGGTGGTGGGGTGGTGNAQNNATAGTANTGGGAGGGEQNSTVARSGGSGVVILAYTTGSHNGAGGITGTTSAGKKYHQFNSTDTFKLGSSTDFQIHTTDLVLHYDAGNYSSRGTSTFTDLSDSGYNGTVTGPTLGQDFYYDFDGSNDLISFSSNGLHTSLKAFEIWFNADSWNGGSYFPFQIGDGQGVEHFLYLDGGGTNYTTVRIGNAQAREAYSATSTWIHVAATINDSNYVELYRNASLVATSTANPSTMSNDTCYLGARNNSGTNGYFNGKIAQLRIYSEKLTAAQITQNYNATKTNFV